MSSTAMSPFRFCLSVLTSTLLVLLLFWIPLIGPVIATFLAALLTVKSWKQGVLVSVFSTGIVGFGIAGILLYTALALDKALWILGAVAQSVFEFSILQYGLVTGMIIIAHTMFIGVIGGFLAGFLKERIYAKTK